MKLGEHEIVLRGEKVLLRPMTEDDWNILLKWNNDPDVLYFSESADVTSHSLEQVQQIYRVVSQNALCFIIEVDGRPIGECWLQRMNLERVLEKYPGQDCRRIDLTIGEKHLWGRGFGTDVIRTLTKFGFEEENADLIFGCDIANYNPRSLKAFQRVGYEIDTRIKQPPGRKAQYVYDVVVLRESGTQVAMAKCQIIDTFPAFLAYWTEAQNKPLDAQIETWAADYMSQWPELLKKQLDDYASQDEDWRQIARERIFPFLSDRLPAMKAAHKNLLEICAPTYSTAQEALGFESGVIFVIYVGIGCGAGWVTWFHDSPAVLFGLENIAECGWSQPQSITGLVAHEIGHLVHEHWRAQHGQAEGSGPWWQLYCEGFAQRCEHVILGRDTWHMRGGNYGDDWLDWCQEQKSWLSAEFLRLVNEGLSIRPFFGSWFEIRNRRQCGYFLGHELIRQLETSMSMKEIALLDNEDARLRRELENLAGSAWQSSNL